MNSPISSDPGRLVWRTRDTSRHLLLAFASSLGITTASGLVLLLAPSNDHLTLVALVVHLVSGLLTLIFFVPFLVTHLQDGQEPLLNLLFPWPLLGPAWKDPLARHRLLGHGLMWGLWLVLLSGLLIALPAVAYLAGHPLTLPYGGHHLLLNLHLWSCGLLLPALALHFPREERP